MIYFNKKSFFAPFFAVFFGVMVIMGSGQALIGTLRWYNPSEEEHEKMGTTQIYVATKIPEKPHFTSLFLPQANQEDVGTYFSANNSDIQNALQTVSPDKAQKIVVRIEQMTQNTNIQVPEMPSSTIDNFQTPVVLEVRPDSASIPRGYDSMIDRVVAGNYFRETLWDFPIIIDTDRTSPRGQVSNEMVTLSGKIQSLTEVGKVLVHELGHMVDIYFLTSSGLSPDPSKSFYTISWSEPSVIKANMSSTAFVSGYAATNQYEDFAESFAMYVFHNSAFKARASKQPYLQKKYDFLHEKVFGEYFQNTAYEVSPVPAKIWDVTKVVVRANALDSIFTVLHEILRDRYL